MWIIWLAATFCGPADMVLHIFDAFAAELCVDKGPSMLDHSRVLLGGSRSIRVSARCFRGDQGVDEEGALASWDAQSRRGGPAGWHQCLRNKGYRHSQRADRC